MESLPYSLLDVAAKSWAADIAGFRSSVEDLEKQLTAALQQGYDSAGPLSAKLRLLPVGCPRLYKTLNLKHHAHLANLIKAEPKHRVSPLIPKSSYPTLPTLLCQLKCAAVRAKTLQPRVGPV